jgi:hypothetical protein
MMKQINDGDLIRPKMREQGGYRVTCCGCGLTHRLDFDITEDDGLHLRVYRDEAETQKQRATAQAFEKDRPQ